MVIITLTCDLVYSQNRDSLLYDLYQKGLISKQKYYESISPIKSFKIINAKIDEVRNKLKYKFALDFIRQQMDSSALISALAYDLIGIDNYKDPIILENFILQHLYQLYKCKSFDGKERYYLLSKCVPGFVGFYLFNDSIKPTYLDKYELDREGRFYFDTLNRGNIFHIEEQTTGSGIYGHHLFLVTIKNRKFVEQFHCYLACLSSWTDTTTRTISSIHYKDINDDGYLDIILKTKVDILDSDKDINVFNKGELEKAIPIRCKSKTVERFIWDEVTLTFKVKE